MPKTLVYQGVPGSLGPQGMQGAAGLQGPQVSWNASQILEDNMELF